MDKKIKQQIEYVCKSFGMELTSIKQQNNKIVSFNVKSQRVVKPDNRFYEAIENLDCVNTFFQRNFRMGKKEEMCAWYSLSVAITDEYFNGVLDMSKVNGKIINFFIDKNIKTPKDLFESTFHVLKEMQLFTRTTKDKKAKRKIWNVKQHYIKFIYKNVFVDETVRQSSYSNDSLIRFKIGDEYHWLREEDVDFVSYNTAPKIDELYTLQYKRDAVLEVVTEEKDIKESDFDLYVDLFRQLNNTTLLRCAGIDITHDEFGR